MSTAKFQIKPSILLLQTIIIIICVFFAQGNEFLLIPVIVLYFFIYIDFINVQRYINRIIGFMVFLLTTIRYFAIPLLIIVSSDYQNLSYYGGIRNGDVYLEGVLFTLWEMIFVGFFIKSRFAKWYHLDGEVNKGYIEFNILEASKTREFILLLAVVALFGYIMLYPKSLTFFSSIFSINDLSDEAIIRSTGAGFGTIAVFVVRSFRLLLPIPFAMALSRKYSIQPKTFYVILGLIIFAIPYGTFFEGTSRNTIIIPIIALVFILPSIFKQHRKIIVTVLLVMLVVVSLVMIIWKSFTRFGLVATGADFGLNGIIQYLELYFAGISNMGKTVLAYQNANISFTHRFIMIYTDIFKNVPYLGSLVDSNNSSISYFFNYIGRTDQVIPASGNGLFYFGYILAPIIPIINISIARLFERKVYRSCLSVDELTVYSYAAVMIAYNIFNNISSLYMKLSIYILPTLIIVWIVKLLANQFRTGR